MEAGKTLDSPPGCPDAIYQLMLRCWRRQPQERAAIKDLRQCLDLLDEESDSPAVLAGSDQRQPDKHAVAIGDASVQHPQPMTTTPNVPYLELVV